MSLNAAGTYECRFGNSSDDPISEKKTLTVFQVFVGDQDNKISKKEFKSFNQHQKQISPLCRYHIYLITRQPQYIL